MAKILLKPEVPRITAYKRGDFRAWLKKNGKRQRRVAVILHKKHTGKSAPTHRELIEEAICFGWIDTTIKRLDEDTFMRNFAKRSEKSKWSNNTLGYAKQLMKDGRMSAEGLYFYKLGLKKPTHDHGIPKNPDMPSGLERALSENKQVKENFELFPPSTKRMYYRWILQAKLSETRKKRIKRVFDAARLGNKNILNPTTKENLN